MELTLIEAREQIEFIINNNRILQERGVDPIAICIEGSAGIGKSDLITDIANTLGYNYISLSLSQLSDPSDLVGWPIKEHYICKHNEEHPENDECKWITAELLPSFENEGWTLTEETRMSYAIPMWLKTIDPTKPLILHLDDYTRCHPQLIQSCNEVILHQKYVSWTLPKYSTVICSANPDNGSYQVASLDSSMQTRLVKFTVKFDIDCWAMWAEAHNIDSRAINFLLSNPELMKENEQGNSKLNARSYTMFTNIISGLEDWSTPEALTMIIKIASGCFNDPDNIISQLFTSFINCKLDKLLTPKELVHNSWDSIKQTLKEHLYTDGQYRADIASIYTTRFINYTLLYLQKPGAPTNVIMDRIIDFVDSDPQLLAEDLLFVMIKTIHKKYPGRCNKLLLNPKINRKLV